MNRSDSAMINIPVAKPLFGEEEEAAVVAVLRSGWVVQGAQVAEFERRVATHVGARYAIATSSCTTSLHLALLLHNIGPGDEVIVPSFTFIATANVVRYVGATPVFADIDPSTGNIDCEWVARAVSSRTKGVIPVHQLGLAADLEGIEHIAQKHDLAIIEDAAPALGAEYKGRRIGGHGHSTCFSFHPRKAITSAEGGMLITDDDVIHEKARILRAHGMSVSDFARHQSSKVIIEQYHDVGFNYRMSDIHAAIGIQQFNRLDYILEQRREVAERYNKAFADFKHVRLPFTSTDTPHTYQSYMLTIQPEAPKTRDELMAELLAAGIQTRRGVMAVHLEPCYYHPGFSLPNTEALSASTILLPIYADMTIVEQDYVIERVRKALSTR